MNINPPKLIIDENKPFEHALFGREEFAKSLTNLLRNVSESLVVFVNAPYGEGKTTFSQMWRAQLKLEKLEAIYFDAYAADYLSDPFVSFSGEILELVDKRLSEGKSLIERQEFKDTAVEVGKRFAGLATKVALRAATLGNVEAAHLEELKKIRTDLASGISEAGARLIEKQLEDHGKEKKALKHFKESLAKLAAKFREEQAFPLTIIVDELDRCRPDFALGLMERIKHLFDVEGVAFVLLVNRSQIESYIQTVYGDVDARAYLLKFGSLFVDLPCQHHVSRSFQYVPGAKEFCATLFNHHGLVTKAQDVGLLKKCLAKLANHFELTLREIEKVFGILAIFYGSQSPAAQHSSPLLVAVLSVLKVKHPSVYDALRKGTLTAQGFFRQVRWEQLEADSTTEFDKKWAKDLLDYYLLSQAEFDSRADLKQFARNMGANRQMAIPALCAALDRFSLSPS
jgi:hypothetical protein